MLNFKLVKYSSLVFQVLNALVLRTAKEKGIDTDNPNAELPQPSISVGVIPGGSTDTVAYTLHGTSDVQTAVLHIILGQFLLIDLQIPFFVCLIMTY